MGKDPATFWHKVRFPLSLAGLHVIFIAYVFVWATLKGRIWLFWRLHSELFGWQMRGVSLRFS
jgi:hypothetical protein